MRLIKVKPSAANREEGDSQQNQGRKPSKRWSEFARRFASALKDNVQNYCMTTTLHGFPYVVNGEGHLEKLFWGLVVVLGFVLSGVVVSQSLKDWSDHPILTVIDTVSLPIQDIQYPTLTICSEDIYDPDELPQITFNQFQLYCKGEEECKKTKKLRDDFMGDLARISQIFLNALKARLGNALNSMEFSSEANIKRGVEISMLAGLRENKTDDLENDLESLFSDKIKGLDTFDDIVNRLSMSSSITEYDWDNRVWLYTIVRFNESNLWQVYNYFERNSTITGKILRGCVGKRSGNLSEIYETCLIQNVRIGDGGVKIFRGLSYAELLVVDTCLGSKSLSFRDCLLRDGRVIQEWCEERESCDYKNLTKEIDFLTKLTAFFLYTPTASNLGTFLATFNPSSNSMRELMEPLQRMINCTRISTRDLSDAFHKHNEYFHSRCNYAHVSEKAILPLLMRYLRFDLFLSSNPSKARTIIGQTLDSFPYTRKENQSIIPLDTVIDFGEDNNTEDFEITTTDVGLCSVHNGASIGKTYRSNNKLEAFEEAFNVQEPLKSDIVNNVGSGRYFRRSYWLHPKPKMTKCVQLTYGRESACEEEDRFVTVSVNQWLDFFSVDAKHFEAYTGLETIVKVKPTVHITSNSFVNLAMGDRSCRYPLEQPDAGRSMFNYYTQKSCLFECRLTFAVSQVNCTPWDFPNPNKDRDVETCTAKDDRLKLFDEAMRDSDNLLECDCLPDCEEIVFETEVSAVPLKTKKICSNTGSPERRMAMEVWSRHHDTLQWRYFQLYDPNKVFIRNFLFNGLSQSELDEACVYTLETYLAKLSIEIPAPRATRIKKVKRVNFGDQLGTLGNNALQTCMDSTESTFLFSGGTLGLFTGLSLISVVEIFYWMYRIGKRILSKSSNFVGGGIVKTESG